MRDQAKKQWDTLDVYKGFALCTLIGLHTTVWWISEKYDGMIAGASQYELLFLIPYFLLFGLFSLSFALTAGVSFWFWLRWDLIEKKTGLILLIITQRLLILLGLGYYLNPMSWYIFQFLALSSLISLIIYRFFSLKGLAAVGLLVAIISEYLRHLMIDWHDSFLKFILLGDSKGLYFWPFFPWYSLFVLGIILGRLSNSKFRKNQKTISKICILIGLLFYNTANFFENILPKIDQKIFWGATIFQPTAFQFLGWTGIILISFGCFDRLLYSRWRFLVNWLKLIGRNSLLLYLLHYCWFVKFIFRWKDNKLTTLVGLIFLQVLVCYSIVILLQIIFRKLLSKENKKSLHLSLSV